MAKQKPIAGVFPSLSWAGASSRAESRDLADDVCPTLLGLFADLNFTKFKKRFPSRESGSMSNPTSKPPCLGFFWIATLLLGSLNDFGWVFTGFTAAVKHTFSQAAAFATAVFGGKIFSLERSLLLAASNDEEMDAVQPLKVQPGRSCQHRRPLPNAASEK